MPALISPELTLSLDPALVAELLRVFGKPRGAAATAPLSIAKLLFEGDASAPLVDAMATIARLSDEAGRRAMRGAFSVVRDAPSFLNDRPACDVAARVVLAAASTNKKERAWATRVLCRAELRRARELPSRIGQEHVADIAFAADADLVGATKRALGDDFVCAWRTDDEDGRTWIAALHEAPANAAIDRRGRRTVARDVRCDLVRIDAKERRVLLLVAVADRVPSYLAELGLTLGGDRALFTRPRPAFTLKRLQELGADGFKALAKPPGVRAWSIVGCQWDPGDDTRLESRGDGLGGLDAHALVSGGYFTRVTFRIVLDAAQVDVFIELPGRISFSDMRLEKQARGALAALGVFEPGALGDDATTLAPYVHPEWRWRAVVGDAAFDRMRGERLLVKVKTTRVATSEFRRLGRSYRVLPVPGEEGVHHAWSEDPSAPALDLSDDATVMWKLDVARLAAKLTRELGCSSARAPTGTILDLGVLAVKSGRVRFFYAMQKIARGQLAAVRNACKVGTTPVLLVPRGRKIAGEGLLEIELDLEEQLGARSIANVVARAAEALGIEDEIEPWRLATDEQLLVIERSTQRVWLAGVPLTELSDAVFKMIETLALANGGVVPVKDLGDAISPGSGYPDVVVRKARARFEKQLNESFASAGVELPKELAERVIVMDGKRRGYRVGVGVLVR